MGPGGDSAVSNPQAWRVVSRNPVCCDAAQSAAQSQGQGPLEGGSRAQLWLHLLGYLIAFHLVLTLVAWD